MYRGFNLQLLTPFFSEADFIKGDNINNKKPQVHSGNTGQLYFSHWHCRPDDALLEPVLVDL